MTDPHEFSEQDGAWIGPYRAPVNASADAAGSIHDDSTAQRLGFRGGTVAGSIHMDQLPPILMRAFGARWFETGGLSTYFLHATTHGEKVRPFAEQPSEEDDTQIAVWMEGDDGTRILEGTASIGSPSEPSELRRRLDRLREPGELRILEHVEAGTEAGERAARVDEGPELEAAQARRTEPLAWYRESSPWGGPILSPWQCVHIMRGPEVGFDLRRHQAVGLFGAIEVRHLAGPVQPGRDYLTRGKLLAVGDTPKTEYLWYESTLCEKTGKDVASMIMMLRFMKASSRLWR